MKNLISALLLLPCLLRAAEGDYLFLRANRTGPATEIKVTPNSNDLLGWNGNNLVNIPRSYLGGGGGPGGSDGVTSVALTMPGIFSVAGSPVTTTGTLAASLATQAANRVFAGPSTGVSAVPTFRALVAADLPDLSGVYQPLNAALTAVSANGAAYYLARTNHTGMQLMSTISDAGALATLSAVTTSQITDGTIVNADISTSAAIALSKLATDPLARANHTGTQAWSTLDSTPTTRLGYGITDAQPLNPNLTAYAGVAASANMLSLLGAVDYAAARVQLTLGNVENIALSTWVGSANITALGTIVTGTWNGTAIAVANGGTGSTTASGARTALGLGTLATQSGTFSGTSSGTNTGDQTITLTGDAAGSGTGSFAVTVKKITETSGPTELTIGTITDGQFLKRVGSTLVSSAAGTGDALTSNPLSQFAATTSAQLLGVLTDESGTGSILTANGSAAALTSFPILNQNTTGSAATLTTPRAINGVNFDGSAAITVTAAASTLTGTTLASNVVASSLTSVGTLASGSIPASLLTGATAITNGGTGSTTAADARTALGLGTLAVQNSTSVSISGGGIAGLGSFSILNSGTGVFNFQVLHLGTLTANHSLTVDLNDADRTVSLSGNLTVPSVAIVSGTNTGDQTTITGNAGTATTLATGRTLAITGDIAWTSPTFDGSGNVTATGTLATVNSNVGSFGSATAAPAVTVNAKGLITDVTTNTITPAVGSITGLGTGIATALVVNIGSAGAPVIFNGAAGTPSSITLTNATGLSLSTGVTGDLPFTKLTQASAASKLIGRGSASGAGDFEEITVGSGLTMSGTTLSASGGGGSGTGTVTSVALTLPGIFSVTGSPITESGTLAASLATQTANRVWAGPTTGSAAAPTFRALVAADIPDLSGTYQPFSSALTTYSGIAPSSNVQSFLGAANYAAMRGLLSLGNVENTALSTWTGSTSIVTLGTISIGTWQGNSIDEAYISSAAIWNAKESALTFSTGLTRTTNTITVNATQNISRLSNLTTNGFLKASGSNGTLSIDTSTYVTSDDAAATYQPLIGTGTLALSKLATDPLARANHTGTQAWSTITSTPTTLAGYGIVDSITAALAASTYQPLTSNLTTYSGITPSANVQTLLGAANYAAFKASLSLGNVENTALSTWAGSTNVTTLGTISAGTWNGSIIAPAYLGTGSSISAKFLRGDGTWQTVSATGGTWGTISGTLADQTDLQTALNSKLDASGGSAIGLASFSILNSGTGALYFQINHVGTLSASRTLTFNLNDSDRVLSLSGNLTISADATVSGTNTGDQTNITGTAGGLSSTLAVTSGGTGQTSYTDGQLLIGNTTGNTLAKATLTAGSGISITNGHGTITIASTSSGGTVTSVALTLPGIFSVTGSPITESGTLAASLATQTANQVFAGPTTGSAATPTFRALVAGDIPSLSAVYQPKNGNLDTLAAGLGASIGQRVVAWDGSSYALLSGALSTAYGGTGISSYAIGDMLYYGAGGMQKLAGNTTTTKKFLTQTGDGTTAGAPAYGQIQAADVPTLNQDTTGAAGGLKTASSTVVVSAATAPTSGQVLTATSSVAASWQTPSGGGGGSATTDNQYFTASGTWTNPSPSTPKRMFVRLVGGGGGGGSGRKGAASTTRCGGGGGGAAGVVEFWALTTDFSSTAAVTVGAGGWGGSAVSANSTNGSAGTAGGYTEFSTTRATGGTAGGGGTTAAASAGTGGTSIIGLSQVTSPSGAISDNSGGAGSAAGVTAVWTPTGGGGGGGITSANTAAAGGAGGAIGAWNSVLELVGGVGGATSSVGGAGVSGRGVGTGGGGGGASTSTNAGTGGAGVFGSGGGGGGAALDSTGFSGGGGYGGNGYALIITYL